MNNKINHLAVWILVAVYFLIGWGWYAIFGEMWLNYHAKTATDIERTHNVSAYLIAFVDSIFVTYALAWLIGRLNATSAVAGLKIAPAKTGRPSASVAIWLVVKSELKSPALKASIGVVLPKPGRTPERKRVQSILVKKNVLL